MGGKAGVDAPPDRRDGHRPRRRAGVLLIGPDRLHTSHQADHAATVLTTTTRRRKLADIPVSERPTTLTRQLKVRPASTSSRPLSEIRSSAGVAAVSDSSPRCWTL